MTKLINSRRFLIVFFSIFTLIVVVFTIVTAHKGKMNYMGGDCKQINLSGSYSYDGGATFNKLDKSVVVSPTKYSTMLIEGHFDRYVDSGSPLYFFVKGLNAKIWINDEMVLDRQYTDTDTWVCINEYDISTKDDIRIELSTDKEYIYNVNFVYFLKRIYNTTKFDLIREMFRQNFLSIIACAVIAMMGMSLLVYRLCFRSGEGDHSGLWACGLMMIVGGSTCFVDDNYISLLIKNIDLLKYMDQLSQAFIVMFVTAYMRRYMASEKSKTRCNFFVIAMATMLSIYLIKAMFVADFSSFDPMFVSFVAAVVFIFVFELMELYRSGKALAKDSRLAFDSVILMISSFIAEMVYFICTGTYLIKMFETALLIFAVVQYYLLVSYNINNYRMARKANELEMELTQSKIKLIISQIQPHFLYNAISTIRVLCTRNPEEAKKALDYFAKFLRANMDSLGTEGCVPFTKELDHVKSYLYIEKLRFGELLNIEYDIQTLDFQCPPLTLQTMAENAVKHGLLAKKEGGTLKISTKETEYCYEIIIEDDGVGFDMTKPIEDNSRSHVGIANTRQRIAGLCGGTLSIGSKIGVGTTITIAIPKSRE